MGRRASVSVASFVARSEEYLHICERDDDCGVNGWFQIYGAYKFKNLFIGVITKVEDGKMYVVGEVDESQYGDGDDPCTYFSVFENHQQVIDSLHSRFGPDPDPDEDDDYYCNIEHIKQLFSSTYAGPRESVEKFVSDFSLGVEIEEGAALQQTL